MYSPVFICHVIIVKAVECKGYIDYDILSSFTGQDLLIRTIIKGKRSADDVWYNAVGILMNDQDVVVGTQGDGQVYYGWYVYLPSFDF